MNEAALRHLKYVLKVVELGSMRKTAQALSVQESTVSRNIAAIEQRLDLLLFERHNNGVSLTAAGRDWVEGVREHYRGLEVALSQGSQQTKHTDLLRIGLSTPFGREFLVRLIDRFEKRYPRIAVTLQDGSCRNHTNAIRRRHLDVAFMCGGYETRPCRREDIWSEGLVALLPLNHRLARKETLTWSDFAGERLLVPQGADGPLLEPWLTDRISAGEHAPAIEQCQACEATVVLKVQIGSGFAITGETFADAIDIAGTVWRPIVGPDSIGTISAVWLDTNPKRAALHLLGIARNMAMELDQKSD